MTNFIKMQKIKDFFYRHQFLLSKLLLFIFVGIFLFIIVKAVKHLNNKNISNREIPRIESDNPQIFIIPKNKGGMKVDNIDRLVYEYISGKKIATVQDRSGKKQGKKIASTGTKDKVRKLDKGNLFSKKQKKNRSPKKVVIPVKKKYSQQSRKNTKRSTIASKKMLETNVQHMIQIGAYSSITATTKNKNKLFITYPTSLKNVKYSIDQHQTAKKEIIYRLRIGPFSTGKKAVTLCNKLKKDKIDCYYTIVKR